MVDRRAEADLPSSLIFSILASVAVLAADRAMAWEPGAAAQATLRAGGAFAEVDAEPEGVALIHAAVDIAAPPKRVWRVMTDCRETPKLIASAAPCRVLSSGPGWDVREQVTRGGLFTPTIRNIYHSDYQPFTLIRFHKVGGDLKVEDGEWRLEPLNDSRGTRVIYVNRIAAVILAPAWMVRASLKNDTPKVLMNLKHEATATRGAG